MTLLYRICILILLILNCQLSQSLHIHTKLCMQGINFNNKFRSLQVHQMQSKLMMSNHQVDFIHTNKPSLLSNFKTKAFPTLKKIISCKFIRTHIYLMILM